MEESTADRKGSQGSGIGRKIIRFGRCYLISMFYVAWLAFLCITSSVGFFSICATCCPDKVPLVKVAANPDLSRIRLNTTSDLHFKDTTEEDRWEALQPTLEILKPVCPEAEEWVRQKHECGMLWYSERGAGYYAAYHPMCRILFVNESMFGVNDEFKATFLAHEFRHSRQNFDKFYKSIVWFLLSGELKTEIYEEEAYQFQYEVGEAIQGKKIKWSGFEKGMDQ